MLDLHMCMWLCGKIDLDQVDLDLDLHVAKFILINL